MLDELALQKKVIGLKQTNRAIKDNLVLKIYVARDADERVISPIVDSCENKGIAVVYVDTMKELGNSAGIDIGSAVVAIIK